MAISKQSIYLKSQKTGFFFSRNVASIYNKALGGHGRSKENALKITGHAGVSVVCLTFS
jgi:hypothetical protein